jgi:predicted enzyme related to lactoylglutathione lyase
MKIKLSRVYVNDQAKALDFYTRVLGFVKRQDIQAGDYRWLTVVSPEEPEGAQLLLELNNNPAAKTFQEAIYKLGMPGAQFFVDDIQSEYERLKKLGVVFTMPPTKTPGSTIAIFEDTSGNLIQIVQLLGKM